MTVLPAGRRWRRLAGPLLFMKGSGQILEFVGWVILARRLGAGPFGEIAIAFLVARYIGVLADWGAAIRGARDVVRDDAHMSVSRSLIRRRNELTAGLTIAYVLGCVVIGQPRLAPIGAVIVALGLNRDWMAIGREQGIRAAVPALVQGGVFAVTAAFAAPDRASLPVAFAYGAAAVASVALNRLPPGRVRNRAPVDGWMLGAVLANQVLTSSDTILLGLLVSTVDAGVYAAIYRIPNAWLAAVAILGSALLPLTTEAAGSAQRYDALGRNALRVSVGAGIVLTAIIPVLVLAVPLLFGADYESGQVPLAILLLATAVATVGAPLHHLYLPVGNDRSYAGFLGAAAGLNLVLNLALIPAFQMTGAAAATLVANVLFAGMLARAVHRHRVTRTSS